MNEPTLNISAARLNLRDLMRVFRRSLMLEAAWNFRQMQNLGFLYALQPALKKLYPDRERRVRAYQRHLRFFNTHPYFASFILGASLNLEEKIARGEPVSRRDVNDLKDMLMSPLAALGDSLFWATWRPFTALIGTAIVMIDLTDNRFGSLSFWGAPLFMGLFNLPHLFLRWHGLRAGYRLGGGVVSDIQRINWQTGIEYCRWIGMAVVGVVLAVTVPGIKDAIWGSSLKTNLIFMMALFVFVAALRLKITPTTMIGAIVVICILIHYMGA